MRLPVLALAALLGGCVFRDAAPARFYRPAATTLDSAAARDATAVATPVRLESVGGTPFLRERIVWRSSAVEYGMYEQRRWSEAPPSYVQRALENALRATPGLRLTDAFDAPALRVEVVAFDDVLAPAHVARVALVVALRGRDRARILDQTFTAEAPVSGDAGSATATAMGSALDAVVAEVASAVAAALRTR